MSRPAQSTAPKVLEKPLAGLLVVALEQAVAALYGSSRLADAGACVLKNADDLAISTAPRIDEHGQMLRAEFAATCGTTA